MKQYGPNNGVNKVVVTGMDFDQMRQFLATAPGVIGDKVEEELRLIAADGVRNMRDRIATASTKTGMAEGRTGRVVTGKMRDSVDQQIRRNKNNVSMRFGWLNGRPGYAFFQEYGTSNGIPAMHALTDAQLEADIAIDRFLKKVTL